MLTVGPGLQGFGVLDGLAWQLGEILVDLCRIDCQGPVGLRS